VLSLKWGVSFCKCFHCHVTVPHSCVGSGAMWKTIVDKFSQWERLHNVVDKDTGTLLLHCRADDKEPA